MKVWICKEDDLFYYAWNKPLIDGKEVVMPDFKWEAWKKIIEDWDKLQQDMKAVYEAL